MQRGKYERLIVQPQDNTVSELFYTAEYSVRTVLLLVVSQLG